MSIREITACLVVGISWAAPASAQQSPVLQPEVSAERQVAEADLMRAEKLLATGKRGPDSEACKLMNFYFLYIVKEAAAAGAKTRVAAWTDLSWEEQNAVSQAVSQKVDKRFERSKRLRTHACWAPS